jgi:pimeloyl-ACP methyl ester carboxylesterase
MHGHGEAPAHVGDLVGALQREGVLAIAPELPWAGRRSYSRSVTDADAQVDAAISNLKDQGARRVYLIGHRLGASYALRYASRPGVNGVVAIAPDHAPESALYVSSFANEIKRARTYIAQGRPQAQLEFSDLSWDNLRTRASATAQSFLSYFDAAGPMNMTRNAQTLRPDVLVLWIVPQGNPRGIREASIEAYKRLPYHVGSRLIELPIPHSDVVNAAVPSIVGWIRDSAAYIQTD